MSRSLAKVTRLGVLSREIRRDYESLQQLVERTRQSCNAVIAETILLGNKLAEAKRLVGHGNWSEWLAKHCSEISVWTARRYMRLSKRAHVPLLENHKSLRRAYLDVGIIRADGESKPRLTVAVPPPLEQVGSRIADGNTDKAQPIVEATVVEEPMVLNEPPAVPAIETPAQAPVTLVKGKVGDLMQCLKPLDARCRKRVAVHLKPLVIFYHRFGKS
jgi:Protein of unknown function (DUF3102)